jgi:hypothetical protein
MWTRSAIGVWWKKFLPEEDKELSLYPLAAGAMPPRKPVRFLCQGFDTIKDNRSGVRYEPEAILGLKQIIGLFREAAVRLSWGRNVGQACREMEIKL